MKKYFLFISLITTCILQAQYLEPGSIAGKLTDKEMNGMGPGNEKSRLSGCSNSNLLNSNIL